MKKHLILFLLVFTVSFSLMACSFTTANFSNLEMASAINMETNKPTTKTTTFSVDTPVIYLTGSLNNAPEGTVIKAEWIYLETDPQTLIDDAELIVNDTDVDFYFELSKPTAGWPIGDYLVKLYIDNEHTIDVNFSVE